MVTTFLLLALITSSPEIRNAIPTVDAQHSRRPLAKTLAGRGSLLAVGLSSNKLEFRPVGLIFSAEDKLKSRTARAKLGDKAEQQQFVCELLGADKQKMQSMALEELPNIGGWYAIQMYRELLSPGARIRYYRAKTKPGQDSKLLSEPRIWSLAQLPKVVPNPPLNLADPKLDNQELLRQVQLWKDWIHANELSLRKLEPTGEGIDFSGRSCEGAKSIPLRNTEGQR